MEILKKEILHNNYCQQHDHAAVLSLLNIGKYICIYIYKVSYIRSFLLSSAVMFFLHWMLNILRLKKYFVKLMSRLLHSTIHQVMWYFWGLILNPLSFSWSIWFFWRKLCFLWSPCLLLIAESVSLDTSDKPTLGFFLENYFSLLNNVVNLTWWT